jgi:hypothetical protein
MKKLVVLSILLSSLIGINKTSAQVGVGVSVQVGIAPPALPVYTQPPCPVEGFLWTPGYWGYGSLGYYWVPGVWVHPARVGFLWTPGYWGCERGAYFWHGGYWGPHVGFYGGVNYGYGYGGSGFCGGRWEGGAYRYNTAVCNVNNASVHNTYVDRTVINNNTNVNHTSFNGPGGVEAHPTASEQSAMNEAHVQPTSEQMAHQTSASSNRNQLASVNGGHPSTTAKSTVGGQRFNSAGTPHAATSTNASHNTSAANRQQPAQQHTSATQNNRGTPASQHSNNFQRANMQRQTQRSSRQPAMRSSGGGRSGGRSRR